MGAFLVVVSRRRRPEILYLNRKFASGWFGGTEGILAWTGLQQILTAKGCFLKDSSRFAPTQVRDPRILRRVLAKSLGNSHLTTKWHSNELTKSSKTSVVTHQLSAVPAPSATTCSTGRRPSWDHQRAPIRAVFFSSPSTSLPTTPSSSSSSSSPSAS